ncbi:MAG TPA: hypothetical protein VJS85_04400 [Rhizomicrobium sp.]|nr:hypothetical protein [Rhizomicrobium sp.]
MRRTDLSPGGTDIRNRAAYTASKGAIPSLTRNMARSQAAGTVRLNRLSPNSSTPHRWPGARSDVYA